MVTINIIFESLNHYPCLWIFLLTPGQAILIEKINNEIERQYKFQDNIIDQKDLLKQVEKNIEKKWRKFICNYNEVYPNATPNQLSQMKMISEILLGIIETDCGFIKDLSYFELLLINHLVFKGTRFNISNDSDIYLNNKHISIKLSSSSSSSSKSSLFSSYLINSSEYEICSRTHTEKDYIQLLGKSEIVEMEKLENIEKVEMKVEENNSKKEQEDKKQKQEEKQEETDSNELPVKIYLATIGNAAYESSAEYVRIYGIAKAIKETIQKNKCQWIHHEDNANQEDPDLFLKFQEFTFPNRTLALRAETMIKYTKDCFDSESSRNCSIEFVFEEEVNALKSMKKEVNKNEEIKNYNYNIL